MDVPEALGQRPSLLFVLDSVLVSCGEDHLSGLADVDRLQMLTHDCLQVLNQLAKGHDYVLQFFLSELASLCFLG